MPKKHILVGLARTVYMHGIWPYIWWFFCQKHRIYTVYVWFWPTLCICPTCAFTAVAATDVEHHLQLHIPNFSFTYQAPATHFQAKYVVHCCLLLLYNSFYRLDTLPLDTASDATTLYCYRFCCHCILLLLLGHCTIRHCFRCHCILLLSLLLPLRFTAIAWTLYH